MMNSKTVLAGVTEVRQGKEAVHLDELRDSHGRVMKDLRVSVTDRCNFRCLYCLPETEEAANFYQTRYQTQSKPNLPIQYLWKPKKELLTFEEIVRLVEIGVSLGIEKVRLTGGEPLLRKDLEHLVARIAAVEGVKDLAMTTNGFLFGPKARALRDAGLKRVSFSLDSTNPENFRRMTGKDGLKAVLENIELARSLGFSPIKINAVMIRGINDQEMVGLAELARKLEVHMRFIEFMPLDSTRVWLKDMVIPGREVLEGLKERFQLQPVESGNRSETAKRWRFAEGGGELGFINPVSEPFCGHCNRLRLTADGHLRTCLFSLNEHDIKGPMRRGESDLEIRNRLSEIVLGKEARHHIGEADFQQPERSMSCIGG